MTNYTQIVDVTVGTQDTNAELHSDATAPTFEWPQGQPLFETNWQAVSQSLRGNGVLSKNALEVTATANAMEIQVDIGEAFFERQTYRLTDPERHTLSEGDADHDRWDSIYFDTSTGASAVREGTPAANPEPPSLNGDELLLAVVYVPATASDLSDANILNWRPPAQPDNNTADIDRKEFSPSATGIVEGAAAGNVFSTGLSDGETLRVEQATFIMGDGTPALTNLDLVIGVLDGEGGENKVGTVLQGDGETIYRNEIGNPLGAYTNTSGSEQTVALLVDNGLFNDGTGGEQDIIANARIKVVR